MPSTIRQMLMLASIMLLGWLPALAAGDEHAGTHWPATQRVSIDQVNHSSYDQLLQKYVDQNGMVAYRQWHANAADRQALKDYLAHLSQAEPSRPATREAKLAYWINAYNAVTIEGILRVYPTTSIRNHTAKLLGYNIWKNLKLHVGGQQFSLEDIEHQVLRKMNEPRIHFAIVCASIGCPRLLNRAYLAQSLESQLVTNTRDFFGRRQNLDAANGTLALSKIMEWYGADFAGSPKEQVAALVEYFPNAAKEVVARGNYRITYQSYDWDLNAQR